MSRIDKLTNPESHHNLVLQRPILWIITLDQNMNAARFSSDQVKIPWALTGISQQHRLPNRSVNTKHQPEDDTRQNLKMNGK